MSQVRESFGRPGDVGPHATATVACFLIQEGAHTEQEGTHPFAVLHPRCRCPGDGIQRFTCCEKVNSRNVHNLFNLFTHEIEHVVF